MGPFYSRAMRVALATARLEIVGACYRGQLKTVGAFYSGTMPAALAPKGIEIVGAFYTGDLKSWAHFIAGLCLQPWPQKELEPWAHVTEDN